MDPLRIFKKKESTAALVVKGADTPATQTNATVDVVDAWRYQQRLAMIDQLIKPLVVSSNFLQLYRTLPEVFWPIDYIAKRISEAHFDLKRVKDDSVVWCNRQGIDSILKEPNPVMSWQEVVYQHMVYKLATGNAFMRAAMPETLGADTIICQWCDNYWELPANLVEVVPVQYGFGSPIFGIATKEELIKGYRLDISPYNGLTIPYYQIWHDRDGLPETCNGFGFLKARSRLMSVLKPIANLIAVYEARNVIYVKRGGIGFIVAQKQDATGTVALEPEEKDDLRKEIDNKYGLAGDKSPYGITDIPIGFVRTNLSIAELQPFDETLEDAIKIAGIFGIPAVLVPRKDQSTFSNQDTAEKSVYTSTIIPQARTFCQSLTKFLGLEEKGYYIDCNFDDVACLQTGRKEQEEVKQIVFTRMLDQFNAGLCTLDDIRAALHEDQKAEEIPLFGKLKFEMTPEELETVNNIIKSQTNNQPSKGEENGTDEKPPVSDEGD